MGEFTEKLVDFVTETQFKDLPEDVVHEAKRVLLDSIGCAILGHLTDMGRISVEFVKGLGGPPESIIIGTNHKVSCVGAAFANGQLINAQEYDAISGNHDVPILIAASLALVENKRTSGRNLILAIVLGLEISKRILLATSEVDKCSRQIATITGYSPYAFVASRGLSASTFGAAVGAGKILNLNREKIAHAIGIAGYTCLPDTMQKWCYVTPMKMPKYGPPGWGAQAGVTSALLAELGFNGDTEVFDGEYGYWRYTGKAGWNADLVLKDLGREWLSRGIMYKSYPAGYHKATVLKEFIQIVEDNHLQPDDIEKVTTREYQIIPGTWHEGEPITSEEYYFDSPYLFACAIHRINRAFWHDQEVRQDPKIRDFMKKVECIYVRPGTAGQKMTIEETFFMQPEVEIVTQRKTFKKTALPEKEGMETKIITDQELINKFIENASRVLPLDKTNNIVKTILELEQLENATPLMGLVAL